MSEQPAHTNRLIHESSPYLLQHAHNPVDWYPWGPEALEAARREDKPILLSIGYSACHWCHVMERECFNDEEVAEALQGFVAIKVDREERPDLDELYMNASMLMTGGGGWPLNVFLTPEGHPFFAGTFFPKHPRLGSPGFIHLLVNIRDRWRLSPTEISLIARDVTAALDKTMSSFRPEAPSLAHSERGYRQVVRLYDPAHGGFGPAPKFPYPIVLRYLLAYWRRTGEALALEVAELALENMARGGIFDQLGGGFHRYSTDERWLIPHFEKMLYDQALLVPTYLAAAELTGKQGYLEVARQTLEFALNELRSPEGGFLSSQDAEVEGQEGRLWVWTLEEVERLLGPEEASAVAVFFGISPEGNFDGASVLHRPRTPEQAARYLRLEPAEFAARLARGRAALLAARRSRPRPGVDAKVVTGWNGLMIEALADAYRASGEQRYLEAARAAATLALERLAPAGSPKHVYIGGQARIEAFADDYALLAAGLLALQRADPAGGWLDGARRLAEELFEAFWEPKAGGLLYHRREGHDLILAIRKPTDSPTPSADAWAARVATGLARELGEPRWRERAIATLAPYVARAADQPLFMAATLLATEELLGPSA